MRELSDEARAEIIDALQNSSLLRAVKIYCESTGASLAEGKAACEQLREELRTGRAPASSGADMGLDDLSDDAKHGIVNALRQSNLLEAVKLYRNATGASLAESKAACEQIQSQWEEAAAYEPQMTVEDRDGLYAKWQVAVQRSQSWAE